MTAVTMTGGRRLDWPAILRESALTAFVALLLTVPLVGLRTIDRPTGLLLETRFDEVAAAVAMVFAGRIGLCLIREGVMLPVAALGLAAAGLSAKVHLPTPALDIILLAGGLAIAARGLIGWVLGFRGHAAVARAKAALWEGDSGAVLRKGLRHLYVGLIVAGLLFAATFPMFKFADRHLIDIGTLLLTYVMLGWGLNIVVGLAGLLCLGYVAFFAVGAYAYALLATHAGMGFWACLPLAGLLAAMFGLLLGFPVLRLRGDYFAIVTLGFGEIVRIVLLNWADFTGGPNGIGGIPRPSFFGIAEFAASPPEGMMAFHELFGLDFKPIQRVIFLYYLILALALLVNYFTVRIRKLPLGRAWEALREDEIACTSLGINNTNSKLAAFAISAMFAGFAGAFFATRLAFISPESFTFMESAMILAIVVLGGMGSQVGVVVATFLVVGLPEAFRELEQYRMLAFGLGMVGIMLWRPSGLLSHREPTIRLHARSGPAVEMKEAA